MVKFPDLSGPSKSGAIPDHQESFPSPESYQLPRHHGEQTEGLVINGSVKVFQTLDKRGVTGKTSPELEVKMSEIAIYALGEIIQDRLQQGNQQ